MSGGGGTNTWEVKEKWINTDIFTEDYHRKLYHLKLKGTSVPSAAIGFQKKIIPLNVLIENLMNEAENILKLWGITKKEFNTTLENK